MFSILIIILCAIILLKNVSGKIDVNGEVFPKRDPQSTDGQSDAGTKTEASSLESVLKDVQDAVQNAVHEIKEVITPEDGTKTDSHDSNPEQAQPATESSEPLFKAATFQEKVKQVDRLFGIIGKPLGHSKSMVHFKNKFRAEHISADYRNFELESIEELPGILEENPNLCGFNVTIPYKQDVMKYLDYIDESAKAIGAVNVVKIVWKDGKRELQGYNSDYIGFRDSIAPFIGDRKKALILGTGGVSKAVKYAFDTMGIESKFVSRNSSFDILGYYELSPSILEEYTILVNCTPLGMWPKVDECPDIPYTFMSNIHLLYDVIYNPEETTFLTKGKANGATIKGGMEMWELQAAETWRIWNS